MSRESQSRNERPGACPGCGVPLHLHNPHGCDTSNSYTMRRALEEFMRHEKAAAVKLPVLDHAYDLAANALRAIPSETAITAPEGWKLVPLEPTPAMVNAAMVR